MNTLRRRSVWRLALLSAAIVLGGLVRAVAASAATAPVVRPLAQALARTRSYHITLQTASSGDGPPLTATSTAIVVRRGTTHRLQLPWLAIKAM
jgi:hypothetical protein